MFGKKSAQDYVDKASELIDAGQTDKGMDLVCKALKRDPKHAQAWYLQGCVLLGGGLLEPAIGSFRKSFENAPPEMSHMPLYNLGVALQQAGQIEAAITAFDGVIKLKPDDADSWINKGRLLDDKDQHQQAIEHYDQALKLAPDDSIAWSNKGNSLMALNRFDEALGCYEKALQLDPHNENASLAQDLCRQKKEEAASRN